MTERTVAATTHGRYLVTPAATSEPAPILVGFHGYGEDAESQLARLRSIPGHERWLTVSIQALHRFYDRRTNRVVASWMTRQDRDAAIADNIAYVSACMDAVTSEWPTLPVVVFAGFSQGVGMAYRAAVNEIREVAGVVAVGGDVPPEITPVALQRVPAAIITRGTADTWYSKEKFADDELRLRECSVRVHALEFDGGHEWSGEVDAAISHFLRGARTLACRVETRLDAAAPENA